MDRESDIDVLLGRLREEAAPAPLGLADTVVSRLPSLEAFRRALVAGSLAAIVAAAIVAVVTGFGVARTSAPQVPPELTLFSGTSGLFAERP